MVSYSKKLIDTTKKMAFFIHNTDFLHTLCRLWYSSCETEVIDCGKEERTV